MTAQNQITTFGIKNSAIAYAVSKYNMSHEALLERLEIFERENPTIEGYAASDDEYDSKFRNIYIGDTPYDLIWGHNPSVCFSMRWADLPDNAKIACAWAGEVENGQIVEGKVTEFWATAKWVIEWF